jgi:hypothetical protein
MAESSQSQLRVSGGFQVGTLVPKLGTPLPLKYTIAVYAFFLEIVNGKIRKYKLIR